MEIQPKLECTGSREMVKGFKDFGTLRTGRIADHALLFMVRFVETGLKLPLSFAFTQGTALTLNLRKAIKQHIQALQEDGYFVVATVCDQGYTNVAAVNGLVAESNDVRIKDGDDRSTLQKKIAFCFLLLKCFCWASIFLSYTTEMR